MDISTQHHMCYQKILQLATAYKHHLTKLADSFDLTGAQLHTLCSLAPEHPTSMKCLCDLIGCDASHITIIVERLVANGLIERHESSHDRRVKMISLTQRGADLRALAISRMASNDTHFQQLSDDQRTELLAVLQNITPCSTSPHTDKTA